MLIFQDSKEVIMETKIYKIAKIDGEYATLIDENTGEDLFIAMALLPLGVDVGARLSYTFPDFEIL